MFVILAAVICYQIHKNCVSVYFCLCMSACVHSSVGIIMINIYFLYKNIKLHFRYVVGDVDGDVNGDVDGNEL